MGILSKKTKEQLLKEKEEADRELKEILAEEARVKQEQENAIRAEQAKQATFQRNCQLYGWDKPVLVRWAMLQKWIAAHPNLTEPYPAANGAVLQNPVSIEELIRRYRLEKLVDALQKLTGDEPQTKA